MAPEILRGKTYTPASDIYSFSMIIWEFTSGIPPFNDRAHDLQLVLSICKGERPEIIENTPQCYVNLMKKCWNENPLKRPSVSVVKDIIAGWIFCDYESNNETSDNETSDNETSDNETSKVFGDYKISKELKSNVMEFINAPIGNNKRITEFHPQACYTSHLLDFTSRKVNEILESKCLDYIVVDDKSSKKLDEPNNFILSTIQSSKHSLSTMC
ncbi:hypothetical protein RclHR1_31650001 [Rhizophagus clarus]|uniref:Kinase-like domain-containing protein n=1 Tax=Rhizophagus clarus TaxID=94130 RepID=A0A2Z6QUK6_9GLOM|nr:hypothetical protein RclHR1_15530001 [Rhizophagus clarus]GBB98200.1 hypothetical protein RclHR1_31650001 [Rhizophagus clarus]GES87657.1 kinase-like domain-containing protein [Rhizophagus clarus]